jgi:hypothetical protein
LVYQVIKESRQLAFRKFPLYPPNSRAMMRRYQSRLAHHNRGVKER